MSKRICSINGKDRTLRCPVCHERTGFSEGQWNYGTSGEPSLQSKPGQLTECDHCLTLLEYQGEPGPLTLRVAPRGRVDAFNRLSRVGYEPTVPELIAYVKKYGQQTGD